MIKGIPAWPSRHVLAQRLRFWPDVRASGDFGGEDAGLVLKSQGSTAIQL